ncbi:hypothetical protein E5Q_00652 [Mixia osmundae IAM 14324]|uniref:Amidohydrolase-related domain-containing protein n=2 Tax=Mixia osmundae (strain CBS 9802 / IAM 14324 / JCM 22182 / KY 12970) TaxID=764103 RepID=G7DTU5_MIXOS|nr:hypothetical protein E5Q_00652 [Mixia osmundae IAM 14324]
MEDVSRWSRDVQRQTADSPRPPAPIRAISSEPSDEATARPSLEQDGALTDRALAIDTSPDKPAHSDVLQSRIHTLLHSQSSASTKLADLHAVSMLDSPSSRLTSHFRTVNVSDNARRYAHMASARVAKQPGRQEADARHVRVDIQSIVDPPSLLKLLRGRRKMHLDDHARGGMQDEERCFPRIQRLANGAEIIEYGNGLERNIDATGWNRKNKLAFMDTHGIDISVVSPSSCRLDFLDAQDAIQAATDINAELLQYCQGPVETTSVPKIGDKPEIVMSDRPESAMLGARTQSSSTQSADMSGILSPSIWSTGMDETFKPFAERRLYAFLALPLTRSITSDDLTGFLDSSEASELYSRGYAIPTVGLGRGLADPALEPLWAKLDDQGTPVLIQPSGRCHWNVQFRRDIASHPQPGKPPRRDHIADAQFLDHESNDDDRTVDALSSAYSEAFEMTVTLSELILSGIMDRYPSLKIIFSQAGGVLPLLAVRLHAALGRHDDLRHRLENDVRWYLGRFFYDTADCGPEELAYIEEVISNSPQYEGKEEDLPFVDRVNERADFDPMDQRLGPSRILFGTRHPYHPPSSPDDLINGRWPIVNQSISAIKRLQTWDDDAKAAVFGFTSLELLDLVF